MTAPSGFRGIWRIDEPARAVYSEAAGIQRIMPRAVAVPADAADVVTLVRWAADAAIPLIPRGSGSSMAGGAIGDGVIVDVSRLSEIGQIDANARALRVGPGAVLGAVNERARGSGLRFPVDPSSWSFCTLGGMANTNASGARTMRVGSTRPWIRVLDCVFADGTRAEVRRGREAPDAAIVRHFLDDVAPALLEAERERPSAHDGVRKESSGYGLAAWATSGELIDIIIGSEGTLAIVVGLELALDPLPAVTVSVLASFAELESAVAGATAARVAGASACELLDKTFLDVAAAGPLPVEIPPGTEAVLLAEIEASDGAAASALAGEIAHSFERAGATAVRHADTEAAQRTLWALRHAASPILARLDPSLKSMQFVEDGAVPPAQLPAYVRGVRAALERHGLRGVIFGHAGDAHMHVNPLVDVRLSDWRARVDSLLDDVTALVSTLGGTVSGEHGDGRLRAPLMSRVWSLHALARFAAVKEAFDPRGILNPGVKVAVAAPAHTGDVKYDPALPSLPASARAALDRVEHDRDYSHFRLALLDA